MHHIFIDDNYTISATKDNKLVTVSRNHNINLYDLAADIFLKEYGAIRLHTEDEKIIHRLCDTLFK